MSQVDGKATSQELNPRRVSYNATCTPETSRRCLASSESRGELFTQVPKCGKTVRDRRPDKSRVVAIRRTRVVGIREFPQEGPLTDSRHQFQRNSFAAFLCFVLLHHAAGAQTLTL